MTAAVATSDPRASQAAAEVIRSGGNAIDAAVTAAFVLYVVEPQSCGIGGDGFMFVHNQPGPPIGLDGSGAVPAGLTREALAADGLDNVPARGAKTATPPGAVALLESALHQFGTIGLRDAIAPALQFAREGFSVRPTLAVAAARATADLASEPVLGPLYWPGGNAVVEGATVLNPALADALTLIAREGSSAILTGALAHAIVDAIEAGGGYLSRADLAAHGTVTVDPVRVDFAGHRMWQMPSPTQGPAVLAALRNLSSKGSSKGASNGNAEGDIDWDAAYHAVAAGMIEAGFDPSNVGTSTPSPAKGDTTYIAAVDHDGRGASLITSVFGDFGSHLGVKALGGPIHNRATTFRLVSRPISQGKPPHTTIPGLITRADGSLRFVLGVAGGVMQPQTQVQLTLRTLLENLDPQAAIDKPRFKICFGGDLALEAGHPLAALYPDALNKNPGPEGFGAAQMIGWHDGELCAGADARRGGHAIVIE
ncbi:gamma-glutamyltransferase family protein [soil metagenome]